MKIETERLLIRPLGAGDRSEMLQQWTDPENERVSPNATADQIRAWVEGGDGYPWGVWERETGELVGDCSVHFDTGFQEWELSYGFRRDRWGLGYATEAARACVRYAFEELGVEKIVADVQPEKVDSIRVLEKCGLAHVDELEDGRLFYVITR
jgi:RimJ/RimL family protein N-acetyltransferase